MLNQDIKNPANIEETDSRIIYAGLLLLVIVGALITYKTTASLAVLEKVQATGILKSRFDLIQPDYVFSWAGAFDKTFSYFSVVWIALLFGVLISGAVRVFISPRWLAGLFGGGRIRSQLTAGLAGAPLMLCSCCVAPVFTSVYERSSRLAPSLAFMLGAPSLNPAALILTFMLFGGKIGLVRLLTGGLAVFLPGLLAEQFIKINPAACPVEENSSDSNNSLVIAFVVSCLKVAVQTLPLIIVGVAISMMITQWLPVSNLNSSTAGVIAIMIVAAISVLLAMPTFFEIPLALMMMAAGMPVGAAVAVLVAGPATNLPSLLTIGRSTGEWKVPVLVAAIVWGLAVLGGLLASLI